MNTDLYSPLQQISHPALTNLWVKRDDLIDPYISGNKWRKLKYLLRDAKSKNKTHLVTFGGAYSNHLVATAAATCRSRLKSTAFVRGERVNNEMLLLCKLFGMQLIFTDRESYKDKALLYDIHFGKHAETYFVNEGGASAEAVEGCAEIIRELPSNTRHIFCAAGTGTTAAGLLKGIQQAALDTTLHVIPVLKGGDFIREEISNYVKITDHLILHTEYHFGGYAKTTPDLLNFMKQFIGSHGILIDPVYTAKMFYAINDLANSGYLKQDESIVALHTGGLLGILGMKEKLDNL